MICTGVSVQEPILRCILMTQIWRETVSYSDHLRFQCDINALLEWSNVNKIKFHPGKCKVMKVTLKLKKKSWINSHTVWVMISLNMLKKKKPLELEQHPAYPGLRNANFSSEVQVHDSASSKQPVTLLKIVNRDLFAIKTMVRSLFQYCAKVWRLSTKVTLEKCEALQNPVVK